MGSGLKLVSGVKPGTAGMAPLTGVATAAALNGRDPPFAFISTRICFRIVILSPLPSPSAAPRRHIAHAFPARLGPLEPHPTRRSSASNVARERDSAPTGSAREPYPARISSIYTGCQTERN